MSWDAVNVGASQDEYWLPALEEPVLNLTVGSCYMVSGSVSGPIGGCSVLGTFRAGWGGAGGGRRNISYGWGGVEG